jgi:GTP pyrophosphokinase
MDRKSARQPLSIAAYIGYRDTDNRLKCRFAPKKCTKSPKKAWRRIGNTRKSKLGSARRRKSRRASQNGRKTSSAAVETTQEAEDSEDFIESLKLDLYPKDVYAFTPMGKIIQLPRGATPLDFAYAIHSEVGDACTGAKIKGRIVPLKTELQNGDVVEILTTPNSKPSRDWLNYVVTSKARNRIRHWIADQQRVESIEIGRKLLEKEAEKFRLSPKKLLNDENEMKRIANEYGLGRAEDLLASVGYGKTLPRNVLAKFLGAEKFAELDPEKKKETRLKAA